MSTALLAALLIACSPNSERPGDKTWTDSTTTPATGLPTTTTGVPSDVIVETDPESFDFAAECVGGEQMCNQALSAGLLALPPGHGRGASIVDVDGDGWDDLFEAVDRGDDLMDGKPSTLWHNNQDGTFSPMDLGIAPAHLNSTWGGIWGDYDNDGDPDLFLVNGAYTYPGGTHLYRNDLNVTGTLTDVSASAGILPDIRYWWGASFADYDNDGHLDLVATALHSQDNPAPEWRGGVALYHSNGDGTFTEVSDAEGIVDPIGDNKGPVWIDYDDDADLDLFVSNFGSAGGDAYLGHPTLFRNDGAAGFLDVSLEVMGDVDLFAPTFSAAAADFNQDGVHDLYLGRWASQDWVALFEPGGTWTGVDEGLDMLLGMENVENTMGLGLGDIQGDGWPDLFIGTGNPALAGHALFYCHQAVATAFARCPDGMFGETAVIQNHGSASGDLDHDGDEEVFFNHGGAWLRDHNMGGDSRGDSTLWVNRSPQQNTLAIKLQGTVSNRDAIGARMEVIGTETHHYTVFNAQGFQSQNSAWRTVTLGDATEGLVRIRWPSGRVHEVEVAAGSRVEIVE